MLIRDAPSFDLQSGFKGAEPNFTIVSEPKATLRDIVVGQASLVENAPDATVVVDEDGLIRLVNAQTERLFGYYREELIGQPVETLIPARYHSRHVVDRTEYVIDPRVRPMGVGLDLYGLRKDGTEFPVEISLSPVITSEGKFIASAIRDVTERKAFEQRLQDLNAKLEEASRAKDSFLAGMSHELRTPLNAVLNFTKFVSSGMLGPVNDKQVDALSKTIDSGRHLLSLINDVLDITKIESKMLNLFIEPDVNVREELDTVTATAESLLAGKPVTLIRDISPDLPGVVGDKRRIRQILLNLVSNACKFTDEGSITVSAHVKGDVLEMFVKDSGPGIAPEDHDLIFESFRQTRAGLSQGGGTGLGLAIARRLAEAHGGHLWLESVPGAGATFYVTLPTHSEQLLETMNATISAA